MADEPATSSEHCNTCGTITNHVVEHCSQRDWADILDEKRGIGIDGWDRWETMRCLGCDTVHLKHKWYFSEEFDGYGNRVVHTEHSPARLIRRKPVWRGVGFNFSPNVVGFSALIDEIYLALGHQSYRLAAMGIRALAERVMIDQVGDKGNFAKNIEAFFEAGHVAPRLQKAFEETLIEAGHAAMHRGFDPDIDTIETLMDIIEPLIDDIYYKPARTQKAAKAIPSRSGRPT